MTHAELAALFSYDPATGVLLRKSTGRPAGSPHGNGYLRVNIKGAMVYAHRIAFILYFGFEPEFIDHKDGNRANNIINNLRSCTKAQNNKNKKKRRHGSSKYIGVSFCRHSGRWRAQLVVDGRRINIGRFDTEIEAARAYDKTVIQHNGDYVRVNYA